MAVAVFGSALPLAEPNGVAVIGSDRSLRPVDDTQSSGNLSAQQESSEVVYEHRHDNPTSS